MRAFLRDASWTAVQRVMGRNVTPKWHAMADDNFHAACSSRIILLDDMSEDVKDLTDYQLCKRWACKNALKK